MHSPRGITLNADDSKIKAFIADGDHTVKVLDLASGSLTTLAGQSMVPGFQDGSGTKFNGPMQVLFVPGRARGDTLLVTDSANNRIRVIDTESGMVTTLTGMSEPGDQDGSWGVARFASPRGIARMNSGVVLVTDNNGIRSLTSAACIKTIACADRNAVYPSDASGELTALTPMACECKAGWYGENGRQCNPCGLSTYKSVVGPTPCLDCPANSNSQGWLNLARGVPVQCWFFWR